MTPTIPLTPSITPSVTPSITPTTTGQLPLTRYCYQVLYPCGDTLHCDECEGDPEGTVNNCAQYTYWDAYDNPHVVECLCADTTPYIDVWSSREPDVSGMVLEPCPTPTPTPSN